MEQTFSNNSIDPKVLNSYIRLLEAQLAASRRKNGSEDVEPEAGKPETPTETVNAENVE